jgi:hypothetical protein
VFSLWQTLTFSAEARSVADPSSGATVRLKPYQVLLWLSITHRGLSRLPVGTPRLPALLDTGHNHNLSLREEHLRSCGLETPWPWANTRLRVRDASGREREVPRLLVDVWLHADSPQGEESAYPLRFGFRGAACYPSNGAVPGPHLPLLGLAALCTGTIKLEFHCEPVGGRLLVYVPSSSHVA